MIRHISRLLLASLLVLAATSLPAAKTFSTTPEMSQETTRMVRYLESYHFQGRELTAEDFRQLIPDFMGQLDAHRLFFLAADKDKLNAHYAERLSKDLRYLGNIDAAYETFTIYRDRITSRVAWINQELSKEVDFSTKEEFKWDRSKATWPASAEEADVLWLKRIKFELLQDLLNDKPIATAKENVRKRYQRMLQSLEDFDSEEVQEMYMNALAAMYDPHTTYMSPSTLDDFTMNMRLKLTGIGAQLSEEDGVCTIRELIPGSPAFLSQQLHPNDKIMGVAQGSGEFVDVVGMKLRKVVQLIRGDKNTVVRLLIQPGDATDTSARREVTIVRDVVKLNSSRAHARLQEVPSAEGKDTLSLGVIELPGFYGGDDEEDGKGAPAVTASNDVEQLLRKLIAAGAKGIVLDLRRNGGGLLSEAINITGLFIARGPVVQVKNSSGNIKVLADSDPDLVWDGPLVVLTSRYSASASEIVAGALQNYGRAVVIGDNSTHGKGTVQEIRPIIEQSPFSFFGGGERSGGAEKRSGAAKMTIQKFYLPNGSSTQNRGVVSDITLPSINDLIPIGESDLPHALAWDTIKTANFDGSPMDHQFIEMLRCKSKERQDKLPEFAFVQRSIARFKKFDETKSVSLSLEDRKAQKVDDDAFRQTTKQQRAELAKLNFPNTEIFLDNVEPTPTPAPHADKSDKKDKNKSDEDDEEVEDPATRIDVHLRESLRVLTDAIVLWKQPQLWHKDGKSVAVQTHNQFAPVP